MTLAAIRRLSDPALLADVYDTMQEDANKYCRASLRPEEAPAAILERLQVQHEKARVTFVKHARRGYAGGIIDQIILGLGDQDLLDLAENAPRAEYRMVAACRLRDQDRRLRLASREADAGARGAIRRSVDRILLRADLRAAATPEARQELYGDIIDCLDNKDGAGRDILREMALDSSLDWELRADALQRLGDSRLAREVLVGEEHQQRLARALGGGLVPNL